MDFILSNSMNINICKLFTNLQIPNLSLTPRAAVALDAKAFDLIECPLLFYTLCKFGFGDNLGIQWIQILCIQPLAPL